MLQVRRGVFETNSSSTHTLTIVPHDEFDAWTYGDVYYNEYSDDSWLVNSNERWVTKDRAIVLALGSKYPPVNNDDEVYTYDEMNNMSDEQLDEILRQYGLYSFKKYMTTDGLEYYDQMFYLENGEQYVAFGLYGTDY